MPFGRLPNAHRSCVGSRPSALASPVPLARRRYVLHDAARVSSRALAWQWSGRAALLRGRGHNRVQHSCVLPPRWRPFWVAATQHPHGALLKGRWQSLASPNVHRACLRGCSISSRTNSPACVLGALPWRRSLRTLSSVFVSGTTLSSRGPKVNLAPPRLGFLSLLCGSACKTRPTQTPVLAYPRTSSPKWPAN
jgi:hypothetical protein